MKRRKKLSIRSSNLKEKRILHLDIFKDSNICYMIKPSVRNSQMYLSLYIYCLDILLILLKQSFQTLFSHGSYSSVNSLAIHEDDKCWNSIYIKSHCHSLVIVHIKSTK